jgi:hypothetical protein
LTTPLECEEEHDDGWGKEWCTWQIQLDEGLLEGEKLAVPSTVGTFRNGDYEEEYGY